MTDRNLRVVPDSRAVASKVYNEAMFLSSIPFRPIPSRQVLSHQVWFRQILSRRFVATLLLAGLVTAAAYGQDSDSSKRGRKYKAPPVTSHVEVTVLRATNGKPVENAAVIFHPLSNGHDNGNMELKTNDEGKAMIDLLETGSDVRVQIIADGFQTYGEDYKVDKDNMAIEVKLRRPAGQYSIYKKDEGAKPAQDKSDKSDKSDKTDKPDSKPDAAPKDAAPKDADAKPDASKDDPKPQDSTAAPK